MQLYQTNILLGIPTQYNIVLFFSRQMYTDQFTMVNAKFSCTLSGKTLTYIVYVIAYTIINAHNILLL